MNTAATGSDTVDIQLNNFTIGKQLLQNSMGITIGALIAKLRCNDGIITQIKIDIPRGEIIARISLADGRRSFQRDYLNRRPLASVAARNMSR